MTDAEKKRARAQERRARQAQQRQGQARAGNDAQSRAREKERAAVQKNKRAEEKAQKKLQSAKRKSKKAEKRARRREKKRLAMTPEQLAKLEARRRKSADRRQTIYRWLKRAGIALVVLGAAVLALTLFFRVERVEVTGTTRYSRAEIVSQIDIDEGDNLYLWDKINVRDTILTEFPYVKKVSIERKLPNRIVISVMEAEAALAIQGGTGYYLIDADGKILEYADDPKQLISVSGVSLAGLTPGDHLPRTQDDPALLALTQILEMLGNMDPPPEMAKLNFINLESLEDIHIGYDGRFDIRLGALDSGYGFAERMAFALRVLETKLSPSDVGSLHWDKKDRLHFVPGTLESVQSAASSEAKALLEAQAQTATTGEGGTDTRTFDTDGNDAEADDYDEDYDDTVPYDAE